MWNILCSAERSVYAQGPNPKYSKHTQATNLGYTVYLPTSERKRKDIISNVMGIVVMIPLSVVVSGLCEVSVSVIYSTAWKLTLNHSCLWKL